MDAGEGKKRVLTPQSTVSESVLGDKNSTEAAYTRRQFMT